MRMGFNAAIQQNENNRDVTAEITHIAVNKNQKVDTGTFADIRAQEDPAVTVLETVPKMFSQNEQAIKEDLVKETEKEEEPEQKEQKEQIEQKEQKEQKEEAVPVAVEDAKSSEDTVKS